MESWSDQGIVLRARPHGEAGAIVTCLTETHGRYAGYIRGGQSSRLRGVIEPGNLLAVRWTARTEDSLGTWEVEPDRHLSSPLIADGLKLGALLSACALCDATLPEREAHPSLFHGLLALLETMEMDDWGAAYVLWEVALLRELGFGLDLSRCVAGGPDDTLEWVSPRSGRAVSKEKGAPYQDRLLPLPEFLKPGSGSAAPDEIFKGLHMTGYFLEHWVFVHHRGGIPDERKQFEARYGRRFGLSDAS